MYKLKIVTRLHETLSTPNNLVLFLYHSDIHIYIYIYIYLAVVVLSVASISFFHFHYLSFVIWHVNSLPSRPACLSLILHWNGHRWHIDRCKTIFVGNCILVALSIWSWQWCIQLSKFLLGNFLLLERYLQLLVTGMIGLLSACCIFDYIPLRLVSHDFSRFSKTLPGTLDLFPIFQGVFLMCQVKPSY